MKLSVITPSYNQGMYIDTCLQGVWRAVHGDIEVEQIIIDNLSTDNTKEIVTKFKKDNPSCNIKFISERDNGHQEGITKGVNMATGDFISVCNTSDYYTNIYWLQNACKTIEKKQVNCVWGMTGIIKEVDNAFILVGIGGQKAFDLKKEIGMKCYGLMDYMKYKIGFIECTAVFTDSVLKTLMPLRNQSHPWLQLQYDFYYKEYTSLFILGMVAATRIHADSISKKDGKKAERDAFDKIRMQIDRLKIEGYNGFKL